MALEIPVELWTVQQAAEYFQVKPATIWRWFEKKGFPVHRMSEGAAGTVRIDPLDAYVWFRQHKRVVPQPPSRPISRSSRRRITR